MAGKTSKPTPTEVGKLRLVPLEEWARAQVREGERELVAGFVHECRRLKLTHAVATEFERIYTEFKHKPA